MRRKTMNMKEKLLSLIGQEIRLLVAKSDEGVIKGTVREVGDDYIILEQGGVLLAIRS
jgi:ferredoxin-fold anticodon binding domain-containing protein